MAHVSEHRGLTTSASPGLCWECHDPAAEGFERKHLGLVTTETDCLTCHTPHAAPDRGLIWPNRHAPFSEQSCDECHTEGH